VLDLQISVANANVRAAENEAVAAKLVAEKWIAERNAKWRQLVEEFHIAPNERVNYKTGAIETAEPDR
jgi:hypothetical protein